ncbi:MAG: Rnf-Nqr domain containing protein [Pseudomonadota bacterium]
MAVSPKKVTKEGIWGNNPVFRQVLGICSALAVTNLVVNTLVMCIGLIYTLALSSLTASVFRNVTPFRLRMISSTLIIAAYVIVLHNFLMAFLPEISAQLGPYVGLIITNCIVLGRVESFAGRNKPWLSFLDGAASGIGYSVVLLTIAVFREALGFGTIAGFPLPFEFTKWTIMVVAPGAFFMLALLVWISRWLQAGPEAASESVKK